VGTVEHRSIVEPIRSMDSESISYVQAECTSVDIENNTIVCKDSTSTFPLEYDHLVVAVGCGVNTFGIKGVPEHALFMKEIDDSKKIRDKIQLNFELAALPTKTEEERSRLLHFYVVGGGPSGVEFCGELNDFIKNDLSRSYPHFKSQVKVTLVEALPDILPSFNKDLVSYARQSLANSGVEVKTRSAVTGVDKETFTMKSLTEGTEEQVPYGAMVWVAGIAHRPITRTIMSTLKEFQTDRRGLLVDGNLRVKGTKNIFAIGDCAFTGNPPTAQVAAQEGEYVGRVFNHLSDSYSHDQSDEEVEKAITECAPFKYNHRGSFAYLGDSHALGEVKGKF
jgi:NADH:ubiquinone reductase (non-electrogenic)